MRQNVLKVLEQDAGPLETGTQVRAPAPPCMLQGATRVSCRRMLSSHQHARPVHLRSPRDLAALRQEDPCRVKMCSALRPRRHERHAQAGWAATPAAAAGGDAAEGDGQAGAWDACDGDDDDSDELVALQRRSWVRAPSGCPALPACSRGSPPARERQSAPGCSATAGGCAASSARDLCAQEEAAPQDMQPEMQQTHAGAEASASTPARVSGVPPALAKLHHLGIGKR